MKVAVIGAGSTYTPELMSGLSRLRDRLPVDQLTLMDPDEERLNIVGGFAQRIAAHDGLPADVVLTRDRATALRDADAVLIQLRVGGQQARLGDETFPLPCGCIGQETTGAGGAAKALRTVPVVLDIADHARRIARPGAWIVDFTNPVGIVTRALLDAGHRAVGLCNFAIGMQRWAASLLGVAHWRVQVDPIGLNHFSWVRRVLLDGVDVLPDLIATRMDELTARMPFSAELIELLGAIPSYYLRYYYAHDVVLEEQQRSRPRALDVMDIERSLLATYSDAQAVKTPPELEQRGGAYYSDAAVELLSSLVNGDGATHVVNVRNDGIVTGLADDDVIETACRVDEGGPVPLPQSQVPADFRGWIAAVSSYERLIAAAATTGDRSVLRRALLAHPLIAQWDVVADLMPRMLTNGAKFLSQFDATP